MKSAILIVLILCFGAIFIALIQGEAPNHYFGEYRFLTYVSFLQLLTISIFSFCIFALRKNKAQPITWKNPSVVWLIIAVGFVYLSVDEIAMIHEKMDYFIHWVFKLKKTGLTDRIDDLIVASYSLVAIGIIYFYRKELVRYRKVFPQLVIGFVLALSEAILDTLSNREDVVAYFISDPYLASKYCAWLVAFEGTLKLTAEAVFLYIIYYCYYMTQEWSGTILRNEYS